MNLNYLIAQAWRCYNHNQYDVMSFELITI